MGITGDVYDEMVRSEAMKFVDFAYIGRCVALLDQFFQFNDL